MTATQKLKRAWDFCVAAFRFLQKLDTAFNEAARGTQTPLRAAPCPRVFEVWHESPTSPAAKIGRFTV